jgi:hypothetical protein
VTAGKRQKVDFQGNRLMSRQLQQGSRIVAIVKVVKEPGRQINYGTGRDVSGETVQDAMAPLEIHWSNGSYFDLPVGK